MSGTTLTSGSANGYVLELQHGPYRYTERAYWAAPFFVLACWPPQVDDDEPLLIHCEDAAHALSALSVGGVLLDAEFNRIERRVLEELAAAA